MTVFFFVKGLFGPIRAVPINEQYYYFCYLGIIFILKSNIGHLLPKLLQMVFAEKMVVWEFGQYTG